MADTETKTTVKKNSDDFLENLNATAYRLNLLCNRFEKDKDLMLKEHADIIVAIKALQKDMAAFEKIKLNLVECMTSNINKTSKTIADDAGECIRNTLKINIRHSIDQLEGIIDHAKTSIKFFDNWHFKRILWNIFLSAVLPIALGLLTVKIFMPEQVIKYDKKSCAAYAQICKYEGNYATTSRLR